MMNFVRRLGLVVLAALALTAFGNAATAGASQFAGETYPAHLEASGSQYSSIVVIPGYFGGECTPPRLSGELKADSGSVTMAAVEGGTCVGNYPLFGEATGPLKMNGCG